MPNLGDILSGALGGEYSMGRPLDEEERRRIEELRAKGIYVPQERKMSPFSYGAGTVNKQNLGAIRAAMQPDQQRRMSELMFQRGEGARQAAAVEKFNREQDFANQLIRQNRARQIADEETRQRLGGLPTTTPQQRFRKSTAFGESPMISKEDFVAGATPQITDRQRAEHAVLQREITPSLTQAEALKQAQQKTVTGQIDVETKRRADDLAKQVHSYLPSDYAKSVADSQILGLELKTLLDTHRLAVSKKLGEKLMQTEADASIATKKQEIMAIESLESWLVNDPVGQQLMREGGPQREAQRMKLTALRIQLIEAENRQTSLRRSNWWPEGSDGSSGGGGSGSGWDSSRPTIELP